MDKDACRKSLLLDDPTRRQVLQHNLKAVRWDILATNLTRKEHRYFPVNDILASVDDASLGTFMDVFLAGITTIPYFRAMTIGDEYFVEGGYMDNTPMRSLFEDPEVDEIIAIDFTDYDHHRELQKLYDSQMFTLPLNSIDMYLLVSDIQLSLPNMKIFTQAQLINRLLEAIGKDSLEVDGKTLYRKPLHVLKPSNLESMTISLKDSTAQKRYFELGQKETETLFASL